MDIHIKLEGNLSAAIYAQLRAAILDGRLRPGETLPPSRDFARQLDVSRNTVTNAYQRLMAEGFLEGRAGAGTIVRDEGARPRQARRARAGTAIKPRAAWTPLMRDAIPKFVDVEYDFGVGVPDVRLFPWDTWRRLVARQLRPSRRRSGAYGEPAGHPKLRDAIARQAGLSRSVVASADDVVVTSGAQQALDLIARLLIEPGDRVAIEDPGYPMARRLFQSHGARIVSVPVDDEGIDVSALPGDVRLVYVTPSHQFPLGMPMSLARRMALLAWAEQHGAAIIEDDYDSEFRFDGRPLEPLQSLDRGGRVLYVGSFSKTLLPTLRTGFVVAPASLMEGLRVAKLLTDWHTPLETQAALAQFIDDGHFMRHVRRLRRVYQERRERIASALRRHAGGRLIDVPSSAGLHVSAFFADRGVDTNAMMRKASRAGLALEALSQYYVSRPRGGVALGYGAIAAGKIEEGIRRLAACL